jgi:molybdopterin converting factor small subunit
VLEQISEKSLKSRSTGADERARWGASPAAADTSPAGTIRPGHPGVLGSCGGTLADVAVLRMFASAREAAGTGQDVVEGTTVGEVLDVAVARYGPAFDRVLGTCRIWVNGETAGRDAPVRPSDEVAVLPPVSGGSR